MMGLNFFRGLFSTPPISKTHRSGCCCVLETGPERKAYLDAFDDGDGPYMEGGYMVDGHITTHPLWPDFKAWADRNLGQGYSLACHEGSLIDDVTSWCFEGYRAGKDSAWASPRAATPFDSEAARCQVWWESLDERERKMTPAFIAWCAWKAALHVPVSSDPAPDVTSIKAAG